MPSRPVHGTRAMSGNLINNTTPTRKTFRIMHRPGNAHIVPPCGSGRGRGGGGGGGTDRERERERERGGASPAAAPTAVNVSADRFICRTPIHLGGAVGQAALRRVCFCSRDGFDRSRRTAVGPLAKRRPVPATARLSAAAPLPPPPPPPPPGARRRCRS